MSDLEQKIARLLMDWYRKHSRPLPWRKTTDPYAIWIAEIILQQTRVEQGKNYYLRFLERFPGIEKLADAGEDEVLKAWQGLGYYSRARNLHHAARQIMASGGGTAFPSTYEDLLQLKGVGPYTAAAVASIAFGEPRPVMDGNVHRLLSRFWGIEEPPGIPPARSRLYERAAAMMDPGDPGLYNQSLMEYGAMVCTPATPDCKSCVIRKHCVARREGRTATLPLRKPAIRQKHRHFHYLILEHAGRIPLRRRQANEIWQGLYELPMIETAGHVSAAQLRRTTAWKMLAGDAEAHEISEPVNHALTHQLIRARFYHIQLRNDQQLRSMGYLMIERHRLDDFPVPKLIERALERLRG